MNIFNKIINLFKGKPKQPKVEPTIGVPVFTQGEGSVTICYTGSTQSCSYFHEPDAADVAEYVNNRTEALKNFKKPAIGKKEIQAKTVTEQKEIDWVKGIIRVVKQNKSNG